MTEPDPLTNEEILARLDVIIRKVKELQQEMEAIFQDATNDIG